MCDRITHKFAFPGASPSSMAYVSSLPLVVWNPLRFARLATNDKHNGASYTAGNEPITKAQRCSSNLADEVAKAITRAESA